MSTSVLSQRLLDRVEADSHSLSDSLVVAAEAAKCVLVENSTRDVKSLVDSVNEVLPPSATVLERGVAIGMVLGLQTSELTK